MVLDLFQNNIKVCHLIMLLTTQASSAILQEDRSVTKPSFTKPQRLVSLQAKPAGESISFKCTATGSPSPNITWTKDGQLVLPEDRVRFTKWQIILSDLQPSDEGLYKCIVCNIAGCIEHTTKLEVLDREPSKPQFLTGYPRNETVQVNLEAKLECRTFSDSDANVSWVRYHVEDGDTIPENVTELGQGANLVFNNVTFNDEGWYTCIVMNSYGTSYRSAFLRVVDLFQEIDGSKLSYSLSSLVLFWYICIIFAIFIVSATRNGILRTNQTRNLKQRYLRSIFTQIDVEESIKAENSIYVTHKSDYYEHPKELEFPRDLLILGKILGEGAFGRVVQAEAIGLIDGQGPVAVAVKMLKEDHSEEDIKELLCEMEIMKKVGIHPNIINFLGCCTQGGPPLIIVEFAALGNLKDFLRNHRLQSHGTIDTKLILTNNELVSFAYQIANGMTHLSSMKCIHRDLAARNILVGEGRIMKIADFGLARDVHSREYYRKLTSGKFPIRWMAPESLEQLVFDFRSDVWSYGVLFWEIMTLGDQPYPLIADWNSMVKFLQQGQRLDCPQNCPLNLYLLMKECWHYNAEERPTFREILRHLKLIINSSSDYEYNINDQYSSPLNSVNYI